MWNNPNESRAGLTGQVYVAPVGTALPTTPSAALNSAFVGLGFHTEDGISLSAPVNVTEYGAWQTKYPIRREVDSREFMFTFSLLQFNEETVKLAFGGGSFTSVSGGYKFSPPTATDAIDERSLVADIDDGTERTRFIIPRGSVTEGVDTQFTRSALSQLNVSFKALFPADGSLPWYYLDSDTTAYAAGS